MPCDGPSNPASGNTHGSPVCFCPAVALAASACLNAADDHVNPADNDSNAGTIAALWRSLDKVNATVFQPGDNVLFKRGGILMLGADNEQVSCNQPIGSQGHFVDLNGQIVLDLEETNRTAGNSWRLIDTDNLNVTDDSGFSVASSAGSFTPNGGVRTLRDGLILWSYTQATGVLAATATNDSYPNWLDTNWPGIADHSASGDLDHDNIPDFLFTIHRRNDSTSDTNQFFQYGDDLTSWKHVPPVPGGMVCLAPNTPEVGFDELLITVPKANNDRMFGHLKVASSDMNPLTTSLPEVMYTDAQMPFTMDGSRAPLQENDGSMTALQTAMGLSPYSFRHRGTHANIGGVPYLIVDGDVHSYFNEHDGPAPSDHRFLSVARAKLADVMTAVVGNPVTQFWKYSHEVGTEF